jgi:prohibitin 2
MTMPSAADFSHFPIAKLIKWAVIVIVALIVLFGSTYVVEQGRYGVVTRFGDITNVTTPGLHYKFPIVDTVIDIPSSLQTVAVSSTAVSKDIQEVQTAVNVQYQIPPNVVRQTYSNYRDNIKTMETAIIVPGIESVTKAVTSKYTAEQLVTKREEVSAVLKGALAKHLSANAGVIVTKCDITNFGFSPSFTKAIEAKVVAIQDVLTEQQSLARKQVFVQQQVALATADAQSTRIRADAESYAMKKQNENATDLTVRLREAEAKIIEANAHAVAAQNWRPNVIGGQPLVQVSDSAGK